MPTLNFRLLALWAALMILSQSAWATVDVKGAKFSDSYVLAGQSLQLNGAGMRVKLIVDVYAAGLYLPKKDRSAAGALAQAGAKSMHIVLFRDLTGEDFASAMVKGFHHNNTEADIAKYQAKLDEIKQLMVAFGSVKKGSVIHIDCVPGTGIKVLIDGVQKGSDIGSDEAFYSALLRIWLGLHPVDSGLKQALLGE